MKKSLEYFFGQQPNVLKEHKNIIYFANLQKKKMKEKLLQSLELTTKK